MNPGEPYACLARLFDYPRDRAALLDSAERAETCLGRIGSGAALAEFRRFVAGTDLARLQEEYVAAFDLSPSRAPYLAHHLCGDHFRKGDVMIRVAERYRRHGFASPPGELPDHLPALFDFLGHLSRTGARAERRELVSGLVLPGLAAMRARFGGGDGTPWIGVIGAALDLCAADCRGSVPW